MDNKEQDKKQTLNDTANHILWIDISYAFFIFHGATQPATHPIFEMILSSTNNYVLSATVYLCISLAATVFISFILTKYAFIPFGTFVNKKINSWRK